MNIPTSGNTHIDNDNIDTVDVLGVDGLGLEDRRADRDRKTRQLLRTTDDINNLNLFGFLIALFMGIKDDEGLSSNPAISELASALAIDETTLRTTVNNYRSGEITAYQAASQTRQRMDIPRMDMSRAEAAVAQYAETGNPLLELIADKESGGDYNRVYGRGVKRENLTSMTINEVQAWQRQYVNNGSPSSAAGKYQIIQKTLAGLEEEMGLTGNELFDEEMQDRMATHLLNSRGYQRYLAGDPKMDEGTFMRNISKEWASMPKDEGGRSYYAGDGLNKAHATPATLLLAMRYSKDGPPEDNLSTAFAQGGVEENDPEQPDPLVDSFDGKGRDETLVAANETPPNNHDISVTTTAAAPVV
tara:strand:+ start:2287 stop:3366 length:1080 start_codon:yes stop_codon:yes gene_type:complete